MNEQKHKQIEFAPLKSKKITAVFDEPSLNTGCRLKLPLQGGFFRLKIVYSSGERAGPCNSIERA